MTASTTRCASDGPIGPLLPPTKYLRALARHRAKENLWPASPPQKPIRTRAKLSRRPSTSCEQDVRALLPFEDVFHPGHAHTLWPARPTASGGKRLSSSGRQTWRRCRTCTPSAEG